VPSHPRASSPCAERMAQQVTGGERFRADFVPAALGVGRRHGAARFDELDAVFVLDT
jgi:hypothetical protein